MRRYDTTPATVGGCPTCAGVKDGRRKSEDAISPFPLAQNEKYAQKAQLVENILQES
jgi:hypothetical protein